ncbi:type VI secretion system secreted protein VgrG, partial [Rhizobium sp. UGM030330-04]
VSTFKSDSVGVARAEQIGVSKVTNVGQTSLESVGKTKKTTVGERYEINVGKAIFTQTENHTVIVSDKIVLAAPGGVIEINKNGVFIKASKFEVKANAVNFKRGSAGKSTNKPFAEDCSKK